MKKGTFLKAIFFLLTCFFVSQALIGPAGVCAQTRQARLDIIPPSTTQPINTEFPLVVQLDASHNIQGAGVTVKFDKAVLELSQEIAVNSAFFPMTLQKTSRADANMTGLIEVRLANLEEAGVSPAVDLFTMTFKGVAGGEAYVRFEGEQEVTGIFPESLDQMIPVTTKVDGTHVIEGAPTVTPTIGPTATPTTQPTATPTTQPTATPTPTTPPSGQVLNIRHETDLSEYDSLGTDGGDLSQAVGAALGETEGGLQARIDDANSLYGQADFSQLSPTAYRFRFYFDPNGVSLPDFGQITLAQMRADGGNKLVARIQQRSSLGGLTFYVRYVDDNGVWTTMRQPNISDAEHYAEVLVEYASGASANDGQITYWLDGVRTNQHTGLDLYNVRPYNVRLGTPWVSNAATSGVVYLDEFVLRNDAIEIGPISPRPTATPTTQPTATPTTQPTATPTIPPVDRRAVLSLVPAAGGVVVGEQLNLAVHLESATEEEYSLVGVGIRLNFQKDFLEFKSVSWDSDWFNLPLDIPDTPEELAQVNANGELEVYLASTLPHDQIGATPADIFGLTFQGRAIASAAEVGYGALDVQEVIGYFSGEQDKTITVTGATGGAYEVTTSSQEASLNFQTKFQGVNTARPDQALNLSFRSSQLGMVNREVVVRADPLGVFSGSVPDLQSGYWEILAKGPTHLQKLFKITLAPGVNNVDWTSAPLLTGDAQASGSSFNRVDIFDLALLSQHFGTRMPATGSQADLDLDGDVDIFDLVFISENFGLEGES